MINKILDDRMFTSKLCLRIERLCRNTALEIEEINRETLSDRRDVENLYIHFRREGLNKWDADISAKINAIRDVLLEELT